MFREIIKILNNNPEYIKTYIIPALLFSLDFILRAVLKINLVDAGADMALLSVATFVAIIVDDFKNDGQNILISLVFFLIFLILWIICLSIISSDPIQLKISGTFDFRLLISWFFGLLSLITSGILANLILEESLTIKYER